MCARVSVREMCVLRAPDSAPRSCALRVRDCGSRSGDRATVVRQPSTGPSERWQTTVETYSHTVVVVAGPGSKCRGPLPTRKSILLLLRRPRGLSSYCGEKPVWNGRKRPKFPFLFGCCCSLRTKWPRTCLRVSRAPYFLANASTPNVARVSFLPIRRVPFNRKRRKKD